MDALQTQRGSQAVDRALSILWLFDEQRETLSAADVAELLGVHRSIAARLLGALERQGLLEQDPLTGRHRLGIALVSLAGHVLDRFPVRASGRKALGDLRDRVEETAYLGVLDGSSVVYIDQASSPHVRHNVDWVGRRQSLGEGVIPALLLAFQPPELIEQLLEGERENGRTRVPGFDRSALADLRARGYLARFPDPVSGLVVVAAPVRDHRGAVVAAIAITAPLHRVDQARLDTALVPATLRAAALVSEALGSTQA